MNILIQLYRYNFIFLFLFVISACSPTGDDTSQVEISDLVGLWNSSENKAGKIDVIYTRVTGDGSIIEYDYDGDDVDNGLPCYLVTTGMVKHDTGNMFKVFIDMHAGKQFTVELELLDNGHALKIYFLDKDDPSKTVSSQIWTREPDITKLDKEPSCKKQEV